MSVTTLANTVWTFNNTLDYTDFPSDGITLNFTDSNSDEYIQIGHYGNALRYVQPNHAAIQAYKDGTNTWVTGKQTIHIIDGTDITNADAIAWIEDNATLQVNPLTDLFTDIATAIRTKNGLSTLYYPSQMANAILAIPGGSTTNNQNKSVDPSETQQSVTYDSGYTGLGTVTVNAISSSYVGSAITRRSSSDLSASGYTVTVPSGYYELQVTKDVATTTHPNPTLSINATSGLITAEHVQSSGYVTGSTTSNTLQLTTQSASYINPTTSSQIAVNANVYTLGAITVNAVQTEEKSVTENGDVYPSTGKFLSKVSVNVSSGPTINNQNKSVDPTESQQSITYDSGYTGLGTVTVNAISSTYIGSGITVDPTPTASGATVTIPTGYYSSQTTKSVSTTTHPNPTVSIATNGLITASHVQSSGYVTGSTTTNTLQLTARTSSDLTTSGATVTAPAGYYASSASNSVATMTLPTSASASATSGYTSKATIGRSTSAQYINIPPGYNSAGGYYLISATPNGSATGPSTLSGTSATVSTGSNTLTLTKTGVTTTPTVSAGYVSSATASTATVTLTASVTTKSAATYYPSTTQQSISASQYLTGAQTIAAVTTTNLTANNIVNGVVIKVGDSSDDDRVASVTGNVVLQNYYTGSSAPSSSLGNNGDLYLQS